MQNLLLELESLSKDDLEKVKEKIGILLSKIKEKEKIASFHQDINTKGYAFDTVRFYPEGIPGCTSEELDFYVELEKHGWEDSFWIRKPSKKQEEWVERLKFEYHEYHTDRDHVSPLDDWEYYDYSDNVRGRGILKILIHFKDK